MMNEGRLQQLIDKDEIQGQLYKWATHVGRRDWDAVRSVFWDDANDAHGTFDGGIDEFVKWQNEHHEGIEQSMHFIGVIQIQFATPDLALSEASAICFQRFGRNATHARRSMMGPDKEDHVRPVNANIVGRYIDRFERRNGSWKIANRQTTIDWIQFTEAPWEIPFQPGWHAGKRDQSDPIYEARKRFGSTDLTASNQDRD